jgi:hypothetical protein
VNPYTEFVPYKSVTLEKLTFGLEIKIAREIVNDKDHYIGYKIRGYVWSQDAGKKVEFKYPADWWEAVKERFAPAWFLKRYPVKYTHKEFQVKATYPELMIRGQEPVMRLLESTWTDGFYNFLKDNL